MKQLFHKTVSLPCLQDSQSYLEHWPEHHGFPTGCFFFFKNSSRTGLFSFPAKGVISGTWWAWVGLPGRPCVRSWVWSTSSECAFGPFHPSVSLASTSWIEPEALSEILRKENLNRKTKQEIPSLAVRDFRRKWAVKSTGIYWSSVFLWQAFKNKTSILGHFGTLNWLWYSRVSSVDGMKGMGLRKKRNHYKRVHISLDFLINKEKQINKTHFSIKFS